jgi:hypothetical protein
VQRAIALSLEADGAAFDSRDRPAPLRAGGARRSGGVGGEAEWADRSALKAGQAVIHTDANGAERRAVIVRVSASAHR